MQSLIYALFVFSTFLFFSSKTLAFTSHSEYHSIAISESDGFDTPSEVDGEYESDVLTYSLSFEERWLYISSPRAFTGSFGSLDGEHFFARQSLKMNMPIAERTEFNVIQFRERDFELDADDVIFEIEHRLADSPHGFALFGSASFNKKDDDVGLAYIWRRQEGGSARATRIYVAAPDFDRNKRNTETDRFKQEPYVYGLQLTQFTENGGYKELGLRAEAELEWEFPTTEKLYTYSRYYAYMASRRKTELGFFNWRLEYDNKNEKQKPSTITSTIVAEKWRTARTRLQIENEDKIRKHPLRYGLWLSWGEWAQNSNDQETTFFQPYTWLEIKRRSDYSLDAGLSFVSANRDGAVGAGNPADSRVDSRLNFAFNSLFRKNLIMKALFTFDLEQLDDTDRWEGGNIQLTSSF